MPISDRGLRIGDRRTPRPVECPGPSGTLLELFWKVQRRSGFPSEIRKSQSSISWERCRSGRTGTLGKRVYSQGYRGFESLPLRHQNRKGHLDALDRLQMAFYI